MPLTNPPTAGGSGISGLTTGQRVRAASATTIETDEVKRYSGLFSQGGTDAPDVTERENSVGAIVWTRISAGRYRGTLAGAFPDANKLFPPNRTPIYDNSFLFIGIVMVQHFSADAIEVYTRDAVGDPVDDLLLDSAPYSLEFSVYP